LSSSSSLPSSFYAPSSFEYMSSPAHLSDYDVPDVYTGRLHDTLPV
jgi:hypothetical protein